MWRIRLAFLAVLLVICAPGPTALFGQENPPKDSPAKEPETYEGEPLCHGGRGALPPRGLHMPDPDYDKDARRKKIQGTVVLRVIVTKEGQTADIKVERTLTPGLNQQAIKAVSRWTFQPALQDGKPCPTRVAIEVNFKLY